MARKMAQKQEKTLNFAHFLGKIKGILGGAANQSRTDDLILTKDVLYQLSHSSVNG